MIFKTNDFTVKELPRHPSTITITPASELPDEIPMLLPCTYLGQPYFISVHKVNERMLVRSISKWSKAKQEFIDE